MQTYLILKKRFLFSTIAMLAASSLWAQKNNPVDLQSYTGQYQSEQTGTVNVFAEEGELIVESGNMRLNLQPDATAHHFVYPSRHLTFAFQENENGAIMGMNVMENGKVVDHAGKVSAQGISLYREIIKADSILFHAFNTRDLATIKKLFSEDLEFYHDLGGLSNYEQNIASTTDLFGRDYVLERKLVPGTAEVYPINDYGAVMIGEHEFCHEENGRMDCGTFKFVHIWKKQDGAWELTRVVSVGH